MWVGIIVLRLYQYYQINVGILSSNFNETPSNFSMRNFSLIWKTIISSNQIQFRRIEELIFFWILFKVYFVSALVSFFFLQNFLCFKVIAASSKLFNFQVYTYSFCKQLQPAKVPYFFSKFIWLEVILQ